MTGRQWWQFWKRGGGTPHSPADSYPVAYAIHAMWVANHDALARLATSRSDVRDAWNSQHRPDEKVGPSVSCLNCRKHYKLLKDSYLLSPSEISRELAGQDALLVGGSGMGFVASDKLQDVHFIRWHETINGTIRSIIQTTQAIANGEAPKWTCQKCGKADNDFPIEWSQQWIPSFVSDQQKAFVIDQFKRYIEAEKENVPKIVSTYLKDLVRCESAKLSSP